jgi:carnitine 3-dehydrogenase
MPRPRPDSARRVALVGAGLIGAGWAAQFLARGLEVTATDSGAGAEARMRRLIDRAWPALTELGLAPGADRGRLRFVHAIEEAVAGADFVQESVFDDETLKTEVLARIDARLPADVVVASSTSTFPMTRLQRDCRHPGRCLLGHPFQPPYLVPLVEVGGDRCDPAAIRWAMDFYRANGMRPIHVKKEIVHHVSNRFQRLIYREAIRLVRDGVASAEDVDAAVAYGPGLRWAYMGPLLTRHLGAGEGGFVKAAKTWDRRDLATPDAIMPPAMSDAFLGELAAAIERAAGGRGVAELEEERDRALLGFRKVLKEVRGE